MNKILRGRFALFIAAFVASCGGNDPGPLAGTWRMTGSMPMTVQFRSGETEALGIIEKVSYEARGQEVIVSYRDGPMKGTSIRYTMTGPNTARTELGTLQRVR